MSENKLENKEKPREIRYCENKIMKKLADGTLKEYVVKQRYFTGKKTKDDLKRELTKMELKKAKILELLNS